MTISADRQERPILFSGPMVRAILSGAKTQTRRPLKPQPTVMCLGAGTWYPDSSSPRRKHYATIDQFLRGLPIDFCPYGQPGDRLWVRETWAHYQTVNHVKPGDGSGRAFSEIGDGQAAYKADGFQSIAELKDHIRLVSDAGFEAIEVRGDCWRSSIHMPHWASRLTLEIVSVRVERVQEISSGDIIAEGVDFSQPPHDTDRLAFARLWNGINAKRGFGWDTNPWVWVVEFKRIGD